MMQTLTNCRVVRHECQDFCFVFRFGLDCTRALYPPITECQDCCFVFRFRLDWDNQLGIWDLHSFVIYKPHNSRSLSIFSETDSQSSRH